MTDTTGAAWIWLAKGAGAIAGSAISLAYVLPRDRQEAALRFAVGVVAGAVFGGTAGLKIADELDIVAIIGPVELMLMGSGVASLSAWWALGLLLRTFDHYAGGSVTKRHSEESDADERR